MESRTGRNPVAHFFVKKALQAGLVTRVLIAAIVATLISVGTIVFVYYVQHRSTLLYELDQSANLTKESIIVLILPSLAISIIVNILLALFIGLYASRKYAVPVYKLEQWAKLVRAGKLNATLRFREHAQMQDLTDQFNSLTTDLREKFVEVKKLVARLKNTDRSDEQVERIDEMLSKMDLTSGSSAEKLDATGLITQG